MKREANSLQLHVSILPREAQEEALLCSNFPTGRFTEHQGGKDGGEEAV